MASHKSSVLTKQIGEPNREESGGGILLDQGNTYA
jgi:hypothetical protein